MTSANTSRRAESRLLDSAVRDAVGHVGVSSGGTNPSRRTESGIKRLRSVVVGSTGNPDLPSEENGQHYHVKPRLDMGQQGSKIPPGVAVALKAAAAAAEDVNNNCMKSRMRSSGSVWDRLGIRSRERLGLKESGAQEAARVNIENGEGEDTWEDTQNSGEVDDLMVKRPRWKNMSERLGPREGEDATMAPDTNLRGFGYDQGKMAVEGKWYDPIGRGMKEETNRGDGHFGDTVNYADQGFFRYSALKLPHENVSEDFQESSGSLFYRLGNRGVQGLPHGLISGFSGAINLPNKLPNIHINSNARHLLSKDADIALNTHHDFYTQVSKREMPSEQSPATVDANDVWEMKKRMRQVQLEMAKLRAKQAEVSKEAQKVGSAAMKARSQEEIDLHSVCVTNIHFAATKEMIAAHFSNCGDIVRVTVLMDSGTGKPRGSAYVEFASKDGVEKALSMNDSSLLSRTLKIVQKDAATESVVPPTLSRPSHVPYSSAMRPPPKFMRGSMRRPVTMPRHFAKASHLQWKRGMSSPVDKTATPHFGHTNGLSIPSAGRIAALRSPSPMMGDRFGLGPIRTTRSLSYIRPAPHPSRESSQATQKT